jgi:hypothetical protein
MIRSSLPENGIHFDYDHINIKTSILSISRNFNI